MKRIQYIAALLYPVAVWLVIAYGVDRLYLYILGVVGLLWCASKYPIGTFSAIAGVGLFHLLGATVYWERIYPFAMAASAALSFIQFHDHPGGLLLPIVRKFVSLSPGEVKRLMNCEQVWITFVVANAAVLGAFLFMGEMTTWAIYSTVGFYALLAMGVVATILYVHVPEYWRATLSMVNHIFNFSIFGLMCLFCMPVLVILQVFVRPFGKDWYQSTVRQVCFDSFRFVRWHTRVTRFINWQFVYHNNPEEEVRLLVCNHVGLFDVVAFFAEFRHCCTFVHQKFLQNPLLRPIAQSCGYIPIDPKDPGSQVQGFIRALDWLAAGNQLVVFAEGTRSRDGKLNPLQYGAFKLALESGVPITPVFITLDKPLLTGKIFFSGSLTGVQMRAHVMPNVDLSHYPNNRRGVEQLMTDFEKRYLDFTQSELSLDWTKENNKKSNQLESLHA